MLTATWERFPDRETWMELHRAVPLASAFHTWAWHEAYRRTFGTEGEVLVLREGRDLRGIYPVRPGRIARHHAALVSDHQGPLLHPELPPAAFDTLLERLRERAAFLDLWHLPAEVAGSESRAQSVRLEKRLPLALSGLGKSLRTDVRRGTERAIFATSTDWEAFFALHRERWRRRGLPGAFRRRHREFHQLLEKLDPHRGELLQVRIEGEVAAMVYLLHGEGIATYYQAALNPAIRHGSPGSTAIAEAMRRAYERGHQVFDFGRGDEPYKRRWKPDEAKTTYRRLEPVRGWGWWSQGPFAVAHQVERWLRPHLENWSEPHRKAPIRSKTDSKCVE